MRSNPPCLTDPIGRCGECDACNDDEECDWNKVTPPEVPHE